MNAVVELLDARQWSGMQRMNGELPALQGKVFTQTLGPAELHALALQEQIVRRILASPPEELPSGSEDRTALDNWVALSVLGLMLTGRLPPETAEAFVQQDWMVSAGIWGTLATLLTIPTVRKDVAGRFGLEGLTQKYPALKEEGRTEWGIWQDAALALSMSATLRMQHTLLERLAGGEPGALLKKIFGTKDPFLVGVPPAVARISGELMARKDLQRDFLQRREAAVVNLAALLSEIRALLAEQSGEGDQAKQLHELANRRYELISAQIDPSYSVWRPDLSGPDAPVKTELEEAPAEERAAALARLQRWLEEPAQVPAQGVVGIGPDRLRDYGAALRVLAGLMPPALRERVFLVTESATEAKELWEPLGLFASNSTVLVAKELQRLFGGDSVSRPLFYHATREQAQALQEALTLWELQGRFPVVLREQPSALRQFLAELLANLRGMTPEQLSEDLTFQQVVSDAELLVGA